MLDKIIILSVFLTASLVAEIPEYIKVCGRRNPKFNECLMNSVEHVLPWLRTGIPELDIPPLDPMNIDSIVLQNDKRFRLSASEIIVHGMSYFKVIDANLDFDKQRIDLDVAFPKLVCLAKFNLYVQLLGSFKGTGYSQTNVENVKAKVVITYKYYDHKDGRKIYIDKMKSQLTLKSFNTKFNVTSGIDDPTIIKAMEQSLKETEQELIDMVQPSIEKKISSVVLDLGNKMLKHFTFEELFPDRE